MGEVEPARLKPIVDAVTRSMDVSLPEWVALYKDLHSHPEISLEEFRTAAKLAELIRKAGFTVTEKSAEPAWWLFLKTVTVPPFSSERVLMHFR